jgi:hypothetical protein
MSTQMSEDSVNTVKERLRSFLEYINQYSVDQTQPEFYKCIRSCVALFWQRKTYDYGPNSSGETWSDQKQIPHEEAIKIIKERVIPSLKTAQSIVLKNSLQNKGYAQHFQQLCNDIEALFPEKQTGRTEQTGRTGPSESHRQRMRELLDELRRLLEQSDV